MLPNTDTKSLSPTYQQPEAMAYPGLSGKKQRAVLESWKCLGGDMAAAAEQQHVTIGAANNAVSKQLWHRSLTETARLALYSEVEREALNSEVININGTV